jgi:hypothetical protein
MARHARRFWTASGFDGAKTQSAPGPIAGPALKGISDTSLTFQRARARDRLAPGAGWRSSRHAPRGFPKRPRDLSGFVTSGTTHDAGPAPVSDVRNVPA